MKVQNSKLLKILLTILLVYLSIVYYIYHENKILYFNARYAIATSIENTFGSGNSGVEYKYTVNGRLYSAWDSTEKITIEGAKYFIVYNKKNPHHSSFFVECPVPDSVNYIPKNGFKVIPIKKHQKYVDKYFENILNGWLTQFFPR
jgi:hypothetical protein